MQAVICGGMGGLISMIDASMMETDQAEDGDSADEHDVGDDFDFNKSLRRRSQQDT